MIKKIIGSDEISCIKKQILFVLGLFFSVSSTNAMCPQTVGAITPGEAIWRVSSRIGEAMNVVQSQICALEFSVSVTIPSDCTFVFGQEDIGVGGVYTITQPGIYCLREDISFSTAPAILISSNDVTINLERHTISGGNNAVTGIEISNGVQNINIINGTIENIGGVSPNGIAIRDVVGNTISLQNIAIQDVAFNNNAVAAISFDQGAGIFDINGFLIENCKAYNSGQILVQGSSGIVRNCITEEFRGTGITGGITLQGISDTVLANNLLIEDCVSTSSVGLNEVPLQIFNSVNAVVQDSIVQGSASAPSNNTGVFISGYNSAAVSGCIVQGGSYRSFNVANPLGGTVVLQSCIASGAAASGFELDNPAVNTPMEVKNCVAQNCGFYGFLLFNNGLSTFSDVVLQGCSAIDNGTGGFALLFDIAPSEIASILFEDCYAQGNTGDGFSLVAGHVSAAAAINTIRDVIFRNCTSQSNTGDGFSIGTSTGPFAVSDGLIDGVICENCVAQDNLNGFSFGATATFSKVLHCCSMNNTFTGISSPVISETVILGNSVFNNETDITGVADPSLIVSESLIGAVAGATYWVNVVS